MVRIDILKVRKSIPAIFAQHLLGDLVSAFAWQIIPAQQQRLSDEKKNATIPKKKFRQNVTPKIHKRFSKLNICFGAFVLAIALCPDDVICSVLQMDSIGEIADRGHNRISNEMQWEWWMPRTSAGWHTFSTGTDIRAMQSNKHIQIYHHCYYYCVKWCCVDLALHGLLPIVGYAERRAQLQPGSIVENLSEFFRISRNLSVRLVWLEPSSETTSGCDSELAKA